MTDAHPELPARTFADCLNLLFEASARPAENGCELIEYTNEEIAAAINRTQGAGTITGEYIRRLRRGDSKSPSIQKASALAQAFQVPVDAFNPTSTTAQKVMEEAQRFVDHRRQRLHAEQQAPEVAVLARTARRLSPAGQARVARYARRVAEMEDMEKDIEGDTAQGGMD